MRTTQYLVLIVLTLLPFMQQAKQKNHYYQTNPLILYNKVTALTMAFNTKYGEKFRLPVNAKNSISLIMKNSSAKNYMGTTTYNDYGRNSQFRKDTGKMMNALSTLISEFNRIGFISEIISQGKTPAIMFDIDNTIELTSFDDDYFTKSGINDPSTAHFIEKTCFKNGIACYFITARTCNHNEATATKKWLMKHLKLTGKQISHYVFLSGSISDDACTSDHNEKVAYKDILRQALAEKKHVYWLMSVGDQMTDWFGEHSGLKVWYPNPMFDSSIVGNDQNGKLRGSMLKTVTAPSRACYMKLKDRALKDSTIGYCRSFSSNHYIS